MSVVFAVMLSPKTKRCMLFMKGLLQVLVLVSVFYIAILSPKTNVVRYLVKFCSGYQHWYRHLCIFQLPLPLATVSLCVYQCHINGVGPQWGRVVVCCRDPPRALMQNIAVMTRVNSGFMKFLILCTFISQICCGLWNSQFFVLSFHWFAQHIFHCAHTPLATHVRVDETCNSFTLMSTVYIFSME